MSHDVAGLWVFVVVTLLNTAGLLLDLMLLAMQQPTITERVWENKVLAVPILLVQVVGLAGLAVHFFVEG